MSRISQSTAGQLLREPHNAYWEELGPQIFSSPIQHPVSTSTDVPQSPRSTAPYSSTTHSLGPGVENASERKTLVREPEYEVCQFVRNGYTHITVATSAYHLDDLDKFAGSLPWHGGLSGTYLLADFIKYLIRTMRHPNHSSPLASVAPSLLEDLRETLWAEVLEKNKGSELSLPQDPYDVWSVLVYLLRQIVNVLADHTGQITPHGHAIKAEIHELWAEPKVVRIGFKSHLPHLSTQQIPWHYFPLIDTYGVELWNKEQQR